MSRGIEELWSRLVDLWSRLMSRGIEKFWSRPVESAHESWSQIMNGGIDL